MFMKCRPRFEDGMEMEQLKSHDTNVRFISHIHVHFLSSVISLIVGPVPTPPGTSEQSLSNSGHTLNCSRTPVMETSVLLATEAIA